MQSEFFYHRQLELVHAQHALWSNRYLIWLGLPQPRISYPCQLSIILVEWFINK
jgi:hypothetical protein